MSYILNIETSVDVCSAAIFDDNRLIGYRENTDGKSHASQLTVFIEELLKTQNLTPNQLSAVAVSIGPGSYTGLRIGVSVAKGICYGASIPLIAVPTLEIMAHVFITHKSNDPLPENVLLCPMIDARRLEVYTGLYNSQGKEIEGAKALIIDESSFRKELSENKVFFFGNGAEKCKNILKHSNAIFVKDIHPSALQMAAISFNRFNAKRFEDVAYFEPYYLKDFVATTPKNKVLPGS